MTRDVWTLGRTSGCLLAVSLLACGSKTDKEPPVNPPSLPGNTTQLDIGTKVGNGRGVDVGAVDLSTSMKWSRLIPLDKDRMVLAGDVGGEAGALITNDRGKSWVGHATKADGMVNWSVGMDGTLVLAIAKRQIPKKALPTGAVAPIDTISFLFAAPGQTKLSTPADVLKPDVTGKLETPTIPRGTGLPAVLGPSLASILVEMKPKVYAVAYGNGPGEPPLTGTTELPKDEVPVNAPFGRPPMLLTVTPKQLMIRPWPKPGEKLADPKPVDKVGMTKQLVDELSAGPECEWGAWSFKRVEQNKKTYIVGISPEKTAFFELPSSIVNTSPISCSADRVLVEAIVEKTIPGQPPERLATLVTCPIEAGTCNPPDNRPFLKPWAEQHERKLFMALTQQGVITAQQLRSRNKWAIYLSESVDGGKLYNLQRPVGEGEGNPEDGYDIGALIGFGDRTLMILSAKINKTTRRSWYAMASDDGGSTWILP